MVTIEEIDHDHMTTNIGKNGTALVFKPEIYQTYGEARKEINDLMTGIGYGSLTQVQKEIVGRWSLITDTNELNSLFSSGEQAVINAMHLSQIIPQTVTTDHTEYGTTTYRLVGSVVYSGTMRSEILKVLVCCKCDGVGTTYAIRMYDNTNNQMIAEKTSLTNTEMEIIDLGSILYQPTIDTPIELHVKVTAGTGTVQFQSFTIESI